MILLKKAARTLWQHKKSYAACILLIAIGMMMYVAMSIVIDSLEAAAERFYREQRMPDVFSQVVSAPESAGSRLSNIKGVEDLSMRIVWEVQARMPESGKTATLRLVSLEDPGPDQSMISRPLIHTQFSQSENICYLDPDFFNAHHLSAGDTVQLIIYGSQKVFTIAGTAQSPEYVYTIKDGKELLPNPESFGIAYIPLSALSALLSMEGNYNDIVFTLEDSYTFKDIQTELEDRLAPYGLLNLYEREDQVSYAMLDMELEGIRSMASSIPFVFLAMAAIVLYLTLKRMIEQDRMQIGTLKAFGYSNLAILQHYMFFGLVTGICGGALGCASGYWLSGTMLEMYQEFFNLPDTVIQSSLYYVLVGIFIAVAGSAAGAFAGACSILRLRPAESMRPAAPPPVRRDILNFMPFLRLFLTSGGNMALRSISRNKIRAFFITVGITFSFGMLAFMASYDSMFDEMLFNQFTKVLLYDAKVILNHPLQYHQAIENAYHLPETQKAEGLLEIPVQLKKAHHEETVVLTGIDPQSDLYILYDNQLKKPIPLDNSGIILTDALADKLEAKAGDVLYLSSPYSEDDVKVIVSAIVHQSLGSGAYMAINPLCDMLHLPLSASSLLIKTTQVSGLQERLKTGEHIALVEDKQRTIQHYRDMMDSYTYMIVVMEVISMTIAFAIIYNTSTISLSERKREYATLRVLGLHTREVSAIMGFEYWLLAIAGMLAGIPFTMLLKKSIAQVLVSDLFTFPQHTPAKAYAIAAVGCAAAVMVSNVAAKRNIRRFDMVEVLKERE